MSDEWTERLEVAKNLGKEHGKNAAQWYFDRTDPDRKDYLKVLTGLRDIDPEIMDTLPNDGLSGEHAGDFGMNELAEAVEVDPGDEGFDDICSAYQDGFSEAVIADVEQTCLANLEQIVSFVIEVKIVEQDPFQLLNKLTNVLAKEDCELEDDNVYDENGEHIRY